MQEDATIDEVIKTRENQKVKKEKIAYISQVTKYGFKNLFSNYGYNESMPYSAQVNPNAINFTQDYIRVHGKYLEQMKGWGQPYFNLIENVSKLKVSELQHVMVKVKVKVKVKEK